MPLLTLESVSLAYGHVPLLDHVDLSLDAGDKVALIGRNGTGKSSLLRIVAGARTPTTAGSGACPELRLAYVPQEPQFAAGKTVFEAAAEGLGEAQQRAGRVRAVAHALETGHDAGADRASRSSSATSSMRPTAGASSRASRRCSRA